MADTVNLIEQKRKGIRDDLKKEESKLLGNSNNSSNGNGNGNDGDNSGKSSRKSKSKQKLKSKQITHLTLQMNAINTAYSQARQTLEQQTNITNVAINAHYILIATKLDPDTWGEALREPYEILVEAYEELKDENLRMVYAKEMIPVMQVVGGQDNTPSSHFIHLPYIQLFHVHAKSSANANSNESPIIGALIVEQHLLKISEGLRKRISDKDNNNYKKKLVKDAEETLQNHTQQTNDYIRKHYRRTSIKLHPDRNGESFRKQFEEFTDARDVLANEDLRRKYVREMLTVFQTFGKDYMERSHEAWNQKNRPDQAESNGRGRGNGHGNGHGSGKPLTLEGGLHQQMPKGPIIQHTEQEVTVSIHALRPPHEFYARVRSIRVTFKSSANENCIMDMDRADIVKNIKYDRRGAMYGNLILVGSTALNPGNWDVYWYATLDRVGTDPMSPTNATNESMRTKSSAVATFVVVDKAMKMKLEQFRRAEEACRIVKGEVQRTLDKLKSVDAFQRYGCHHKVLVSAGKKIRNLKWAMNATGNSSSIYDPLHSLLEHSRHALAQIQDRMETTTKRKEKKDYIKKFKTFIAGKLESEDPTYWMMECTEASLKEEGGDSNRLYQIFIEGKGKHVLMVDSDMFLEASYRDDLFSPKQVAELADRAEVARAHEAKEEEAAIAAEAKKILEGKRRKELELEVELQKKWSMIGNTVTIHGLKSEKGKLMNGSLGRVLDYCKDKDRFEVLSIETENKMLMKNDNFTIYFYGNASNNDPTSSQNSAPQDKHEQCHSSDEKGTSPKIVRNEEKANIERERPTNRLTRQNDSKVEKRLYVTSSYSKRLTGRKGNKKKDLIAKSGADIKIGREQTASGRVPIDLCGNATSVGKGVALIQQVVGIDNIYDDIGLPRPDPPDGKLETLPVAVDNLSIEESNGKHNLLGNEFRYNMVSEFDSQPLEIQDQDGYIFGINTSVIESVGVHKESKTDTPLSSLAERSHIPNAHSQQSIQSTEIVPNKNLDELLIFLRQQHACFKGDVEQFFKWLVQSEDIDSMDALKEAVSDDEYLQDTMQTGSGSVGLKGFKRKAFQRSVQNYCCQTIVPSIAPNQLDVPSNNGPASNIASDPFGIGSNAFLPSNLYDSDLTSLRTNNTDDNPPNELFCPLDNVLMTDDPVCAADGITYERKSIERWFHRNMGEIMLAEERLKLNPGLQHERELVNRGIRSPLYDIEMPNVCLTSNSNIRNMARAYKSRNDARRESPQY